MKSSKFVIRDHNNDVHDVIEARNSGIHENCAQRLTPDDVDDSYKIEVEDDNADVNDFGGEGIDDDNVDVCDDGKKRI